MSRQRDCLYAKALNEIVDFRFDASVARVFADMINRSVPGYAEVVRMTGQIADEHAQPGTRCYDLGCSLGASTLSMLHAIGERDVRIVAVDNSADMLERCKHHVGAGNSRVTVDLVCADINDIVIEQASVVVMNYTLQFVPVERRLPLLRRIHAGMVPGGVLILSEKVIFEDARENAWHEVMHHRFKRVNGYSELEISQKRTALENVLMPETEKTHVTRLREAGFDRVLRWHQCLNFMSLMAHR